MNKITNIKNIAQQHGVSVSTVSRALNNRKDISKDTREKILETAEQLNYKPNSIARSLVKNKSYTIGLMVPDISDPFFSKIASSIDENFFGKGYQVIYGNTLRDKENEKKFIDSVFSRKMDGVILTPEYLEDNEILKKISALQIPTLLLRRRPPKGIDIPFLDINHYHGACAAMEYMINKGHSNICFIGMTENSFISNERLRGFVDTLKKYEISFNNKQISVAGRTIEAGTSAMEKLYKENDYMTAVFASNDLLGIGALEWLAKNNISVPNDIAVVGFDNLDISSLYQIQLTTMSQPREEMGLLASKMLLEMIEKAEKVEPNLLNAKLVKRHTC